jgi:hypothetical protein
LGPSAQIADTLKKVTAAGFDEVILSGNVGLKAARPAQGRDGALHGRGGTAGGRG